MAVDAQNDNSSEPSPGWNTELADLALSVHSGVAWQFSFAADDVTWMSGMDVLLGMPGAAAEDVRARLIKLIEPLTTAARSTAVWQDLELEQPLDTSASTARSLHFKARKLGDSQTGLIVGIASDMTETQRDRQALADLADRYRLLVELSPDAICVHQDGVVTYVNPATVTMVGAESDDQLVGRPIVDFLDQPSLEEVRERIACLTEPGARTAPAEAALRRLDGSQVLVESVSVRTTWEGRAAFQVIMRDVTAQKEAEAAVRYQAALVEHVSNAIIATTGDGVVTSWNPAAETVYGIPSEHALGRHVSELVGAPLDPRELLGAGGVTETTHRGSDGSMRIVRVSVARMDGGFVLLCADETARRRAERRYTTVVAALDEGVVVVGVNGLIEAANPAALDILGVEESDIVGSEPTAWPLFDESGEAISFADYPGMHTHRTGEPQNSRVVLAQRPDAAMVWLAVSCRSLDSEDRPPHRVVVSFTDITESRAIRQRLEHEATHDALTGLANRTLALERIRAAACDSQVRSTAVLFVDLDKFKFINDSLGHAVGDQVLRVVGDRLRTAVRRDDLVGRLGGDEFVVVSCGNNDHGSLRALAQRLRSTLAKPMTLEGRALHVDASIGIVLVPPGDSRSAEDVLRDADVAMYQAKTLGRGRATFFDVGLRERVQRHMHLEQDLREASHDDQFWVAYQPIVDLRTGGVVALEALLRWAHPAHGTVSPAEFIPLAEESDLINEIGAHTLRTATHEIATHRELHGLDLKVNLSARQLDDPNLLRSVRGPLAETGMPARRLCLEVTESALMRDPVAATRTLRALRAVGVDLAIDDFGTGYASLVQLQRLPLDTVKIDRSFVAELGTSGDAEVIVTSIIAMAHALGLTVVAEGVETEEQLAVLRRLGCDQAQGFYFGKPVPIGQVRFALSCPRPG